MTQRYQSKDNKLWKMMDKHKSWKLLMMVKKSKRNIICLIKIKRKPKNLNEQNNLKLISNLVKYFIYPFPWIILSDGFDYDKD